MVSSIQVIWILLQSAEYDGYKNVNNRDPHQQHLPAGQQRPRQMSGFTNPDLFANFCVAR